MCDTLVCENYLTGEETIMMFRLVVALVQTAEEWLLPAKAAR